MTLNDYIIENVDKLTEENFIRNFANSEVFFPLTGHAAGLPVGDVLVGSDDQIRLQLADFDAGVMVVFYASKTDSRISGRRFAGMPLINAASMVCELPEVDGILLQSDSTAWIAVLKEELREIVGN
jgi:hypothetical protein